MTELTGAQARLLDEATAAAEPASLSDIEHVVILMQENRSFDHYFGTVSGVRGFSDPDQPPDRPGRHRRGPLRRGGRPDRHAEPGLGQADPCRQAADPGPYHQNVHAPTVSLARDRPGPT